MSNALPIAGAGKITPAHWERQAIVYVRQSSPKQVREHPESQLNQRALVQRAQALGWPPQPTGIICSMSPRCLGR